MSQKSTYFPIGDNNLTIQNIIYMSHVPLDPPIEDLACNMINVRATCKGSLQVATIPNGADIYIYEESQGDYVLRGVKTGTMNYPSTIPDIECTSSTRSNKFKLSLDGYIDVEGILDITNENAYQLYIIMERSTVTTLGGEDFLIPALAIGSFMFFLFGDNKKKHKKEYYDKYKEIYE
jgi:hypothetical protein